MEAKAEGFCSFLVGLSGAPVNSKELKSALEKGDMKARASALEALIRMHLNGEPQNHMIMTVIKFITPLDDHYIKKLVLYFWEVVDKTDASGKLLSEMILICSFLREDLLHPNEYIRGLALRFMCKVKERELVEPLVSSVVQNLTHRVTYVRRNAVLAVHRIFKRFPELLPDAAELVEKFISEENDVSASRNAFEMLVECSPDRVVKFLAELRESKNLESLGATLQMSIVDFAGHMIRANPYDKGRYVTVLFSILQSNNPAVRYQCASTLLSISTSPTAIRQAALTFIDLLKTHTDISVRLIVVDQLDAMRERFSKILQDSLLDILSVLANGTMEIRKRIVTLGVELVSNQNSEVFVQAIKKELYWVKNECDVDDKESLLEYKKLLIRATRTAVARRPHMASAVIPLVLEYLYEEDDSGFEVVSLIREVLQLQPSLRSETLRQLRQTLRMIRCPSVIRTVLWLLGTHVTSADDALEVIRLLINTLEPLPLEPTVKEQMKQQEDFDGHKGGQQKPRMQMTTIVQEDGTYVMSSVPSNKTQEDAEGNDSNCGLRGVLTGGKFFIAAPLASTLSKLIIRLFNHHSSGVDESTMKEAQNSAIMLLNEVLRFCTMDGAAGMIDDATHEQIRLALLNITNPRSPLLATFVEDSSKALDSLTNKVGSIAGGDGFDFNKRNNDNVVGRTSFDEQQVALCSVDTPVMFTQIMEGKGSLLELEAVDDLGSVVANASIEKTEEFLIKLEKTVPLSGFCDPLYCEASVTVHQFDITVDWYIANCTANVLRDVSIELTPLGSMKLCERPQVHTIQPHGSVRIRTALKVGSPETGVICASVLYEGPQNERGCVVLNNVRVDIMNYVRPAKCSASEFRDKWCKYDWENAVAIRTEKTDMREYVEYVMQGTNTRLLEPYPEEDDEVVSAFDGKGDNGHRYVSCNMYARTLFGDDALLNVSIERDAEGKLSGMVRVRANKRPVAYGFGEKLNILNRRIVS
uniref:Coatomer subunit beta n=1 Tax=Trypanosoma brucei brucei TaxID=5702 RepID=COPB_TRYBB|nr:RecName: Full=Coatomer subunit beta; AltName: Full=Beta-coat protein; Short=Beta-COP [Trypanosoma brucei brucei]CAB87383.1 putative coatomer beta subunit [Trypanosoma brucei brucei]